MCMMHARHAVTVACAALQAHLTKKTEETPWRRLADMAHEIGKSDLALYCLNKVKLAMRLNLLISWPCDGSVAGT